MRPGAGPILPWGRKTLSPDEPTSARGGLEPESEDTASDWTSGPTGPETPPPAARPPEETAPVGTDDASTTEPAAATTPKPPKKRRTRRRKIVYIVIAAVIVVLAVSSYVTAEAFSTNKSCNSCHEMNPYYNSWSVSVHKNTNCVQCHIPPGFPSFVKTKILSLRELWVHVFGQAEPPLAVTRKIPNSNCLACHANPPVETKGTTSFPHAAHTTVKCVDCHVRLVHRTVTPPVYVDPMTMSQCLTCHNGKSGAPPSTCSTCHTPPHEPRGECSNCHNTNSFSRTQTAPANHPLALTGGHEGVTCASCHVSKPGVAIIPGTSLPKPAGLTCVSCHAVQHPGLTDCASCHTVAGFAQTTFQHQQVGEHIPTGDHPLTCQNCHTTLLDWAKATCTPCHKGTPSGG